MSQYETMPRENNLFRSETAWIQIFVITMANDLLLYNNSYWQEKLGPEFHKNNHENKLHLIFSLLVFLKISLAQFLTFTFSSKIENVKSRASCFMGYTETANDENTHFPSRAIWHLWLKIFPRSKLHIYEMIRPVACEIALGESDNIVEDWELQVKMIDLTIASIRDLLQLSLWAIFLHGIYESFLRNLSLDTDIDCSNCFFPFTVWYTWRIGIDWAIVDQISSCINSVMKPNLSICHVPSASHHSCAFPFILRPSFMFPLFSVSILLRSVPLSVTLSHFYFRLRPWWARSPDWALNSVGLYFTLLLFMSLYTSVPFPLTLSLLSTFVFLR